MKRFILSLTAAAVLSMPMAASALEKMDNNQLKSSTGQAGVSIAVDDVVIYQKSSADTTYWDADGLAVAGLTNSTGTTNAAGNTADVGAAGVMISHPDKMEKLTTINAILDADNYGVTALKEAFSPDDNEDNTILEEEIGIVDSIPASGLNPGNGNIAGTTTGISPLTIDVGTCQALTDGWAYNTGGDMESTNPLTEETVSGAVAGVVIGLPTVEIKSYNNNNFKSIKVVAGTDNGDGTITRDDLSDSSSHGDHSAMNSTHNTMITIEKSGVSTMAILGGRLEIAPH